MSDLISSIGRLGRVMGFMSHNPEDIVNEAIRREVQRGADTPPIAEARKLGRVIGPALAVEGNERAIARIDRVHVIHEGQSYTSRGHVGRSVVLQKVHVRIFEERR